MFPHIFSQLRPEIYRCNLCWKDEKVLLIGWGDMVKVCVVKERASEEVRDLPNRYVEIGICSLGYNSNKQLDSVMRKGPQWTESLSYQKKDWCAWHGPCMTTTQDIRDLFA